MPISSLARHLLQALRRLRLQPVRTAAIVLTLGLALGSNSAIFSLVNAVLIRPLPFADPDRLVVVWTEFTQQGRLEERLSEPEVQELRQSGTFERLAVFTTLQANLTGQGTPEQIEVALTTSDLLPVLGLQPLLGRNFLPEEERPGAGSVVLLSHGFWTRRLGAETGAIGQRLLLDGQPHTIVGVLPPALRFPENAELWVPLGLDAAAPRGRGLHYLDAIARLPPGRSLPQTSVRLEALARQLQQGFPSFYPEGSGWRLRAEPLLEEQTGAVRPALLLLLCASGLVLLIACVNIANLWLSEIWGRRKDFAVQVAFGASRHHILGQLLLQGLLLGLLGGGLGLVLAHWAVRLFLSVAPTESPRLREVTFDLNVFVFALALSLLVGLATSLIPALQASRGVSQTLREVVGRASQSVRSRRLRGLLVTSEIALALVVVVGAGLLLKNLSGLYRQSPGFRPEGLLTLSLTLPGMKYSTGERVVSFQDELVRQVKALPGVENASAVSHLPLSGRRSSGDYSVEGLAEGGSSAGMEALRLVVGPDYFATMGTPVLQGRAFTAQDRADGAGVVIVDETLARRFWPRGEAVGKRLKRGRPDSGEPWLTIVGVVSRVKSTSLDEDETLPQMYFPSAQSPSLQMVLVVRSPGAEPALLAESVRDTLRQLDPDQPVSTIRTMEEWLAASLSRQRFLALLLTSFALLGLTLAALGIYAVMSSFVTERTYEMGIRLAIGALPREVLRLLFGQSLLLVAGGLSLGLGGTLLLAPVLASQLYRLSPYDPWIYLVSAALLLATALLATYVPARKVARLDPAITLRNLR